MTEKSVGTNQEHELLISDRFKANQMGSSADRVVWIQSFAI
jgi:hypothetical protein